MDRYDPHGGRAYAHRRADTITAEFMDVGIGTEGGREIASLPVFEGEYDREESPRRVWDNASPPNFGYSEAAGMTYQLTSEEFAVNQVSQYVRKVGAPEHSGGANWIFSDSTSGGRVPAEVARAGGEVDGARLPKEAYYVVSAMFRGDPQVHIIGHWSYPAKTRKDVFVVSNADVVELFVNGKPLGKGSVSDRYLFTFKDVAFEPGEIRAVASTGGKVAATQTKRTAGAAVALTLTALTAPGGLRADGSDIALIDVEAVDAEGKRVPTFEQRVDFRIDGPGIWRGGYNSGKINSINQPFLDLEAGVNRVAIRATRSAGTISVRAQAAGLQPASVTIIASPFELRNGFSTTLPAATPSRLPARPPAHPPFVSTPAISASSSVKTGPMAGTFIRTFNYTGPTASIVHVETGAHDGRRIYVDREFTFRGLPDELVGGDWIQIADADQAYSAVDLIELAVTGGSVITIAHDARLPAPQWISTQFRATDVRIEVNGEPMKLFRRTIGGETSVTLGSNIDGPPGNGRMYVVFVSAK
jgi:beta-galactosidase